MDKFWNSTLKVEYSNENKVKFSFFEIYSIFCALFVIFNSIIYLNV
jgi:hypothetical protein